jgi:hypothetical protein
LVGVPEVVLLPVAVAVLLFLWWLWVGRDPRTGTIVATWRPPDEIRPGPAGALIDQRADPGDVLATILDLARRGYLRIVESHPSGVPAKGGPEAAIARVLLEKTGVWETEWRFVRTDKPVDDLATYEGAVLMAIFGLGREVSARALGPTFAAHMPGIYAALYDHLVRRGYFLHSPERARREWVVLAGVVAAAGVAATAWFGRPALGVALLASAGLVVLFSRWMPVPTRRGARARDQLLGLREYIRRAEKGELEFRHAPEKTPELFEEILPYAIALDVTDLWLREFRELLPETTSWYAREGAGPQPTTLGFELASFFTVTLQAISPDS